MNVGCGGSPTPGWLNFDNSLTVLVARTPLGLLPLPGMRAGFISKARASDIRWADAKRLPISTGAAEAIYSSHMLERMSLDEVEAFLAEARRALRPGGVLRIAAPDLRCHVEAYLKHGDADRLVSAIFMGQEKPKSFIKWLRHPTLRPHPRLWMYDGASLSALLTRMGFERAVVLPPGETTILDPGELNLREREAESVYVEAAR